MTNPDLDRLVTIALLQRAGPEFEPGSTQNSCFASLFSFSSFFSLLSFSSFSSFFLLLLSFLFFLCFAFPFLFTSSTLLSLFLLLTVM